MFIRSLSFVNFKNYTEAQLEFSDGINIFVGNNGEGKTNLLDAIFYLCFCKSFLNPIDSQNIRHNERFFLLQGIFQKEEKEIEISCSVQHGQKKKVKRNKKEYERLAEHIGQFPAVVISPYDTNLISEGSDTRRKFIDSIISQFDRTYLETLQRYNKVLEQRNALLKQFYEQRLFANDAIEVWDIQLVDLGLQIHQKRQDFLKDFIPVFQKYFDLISNHREEIHIEYRSQLNDSDFATELKKSERRDMQSGFTQTGIHKDDLIFLIHQQPIKKFGSQGQQKSFLVALKLAQFDIIRRLLNMKPILLLDDVFDKLDHARVTHLMRLVSDHAFGQVFVTDTDLDRIHKVFQDTGMAQRIFKVEGGKLEQSQ
jgi:DNA replication and repair protein RecF